MNVDEMVQVALSALNLPSDTVLYVTVDYEGHDGPGRDTQRTNLQTVLTDLAADQYCDIPSEGQAEWVVDFEKGFREMTRETLFTMLADSGLFRWDRLKYLETSQEKFDREKLEKRRELEVFARQISEKHGPAMDTVEFIQVLHDLIEREDDYRIGLREDGLCATGSMDGWNELNCDSQGRQARYREVLDWLAQHCPMLWAEWTELQLQGVNDDE